MLIHIDATNNIYDKEDDLTHPQVRLKHYAPEKCAPATCLHYRSASQIKTKRTIISIILA